MEEGIQFRRLMDRLTGLLPRMPHTAPMMQEQATLTFHPTACFVACQVCNAWMHGENIGIPTVSPDP